MTRTHTRRWMSLLVLALLLSTLVPSVAFAQSEPGDSEPPTDSLCTGDPNADYTGPCGPSLTVPAWGDAAGWDDPGYADSITLHDLDLDGKEELIGRGPQGLLVNTWSNDWGQWVPASDATQALPFPGGAQDNIVDGSIRFGKLADDLSGVIALTVDGLQTWSWDPGDHTPGSGVWYLQNQDGPFSQSDTTTDWDFTPAYYSTIQFVPEPLGGTDYGLIARGSDGIHFCSWDGSSWSCKLATSAFNDTLVTDPNSNQAWPNNLAEYYWDTIQLGDIYSGSPGPELFGRDNQGGGVLKVYTWDSASQSFTQLKPTGNWPFWTSPGTTGWDAVKYSSTIQTVQLIGKDQPEQVIGRSAVGLQWFTIADSGCGGHTAPCWKNITNFAGQPLSDYDGFNDPQYYETMNFADLNGDGLDELVVRAPGGFVTTAGGLITVWQLHASAGWNLLTTPAPNLQAGPSDDPLWSDPSYYQTIQVGVVTDDQRPTLLARGKYGVRTWQYWANSGWWRPYAYGFQSFGTQAETNAYNLVGGFLNLASSSEVRDQYSSANASVLSNFISCLQQSTQQGAAMPPTETCDVVSSPATPLSNPNGVTSADWHAMATLLLGELGQAAAVSTHFNVATLEIINDTFFQEQVTLDSALTYLFPDPPAPHKDVSASLFGLFTGLGEAWSIAAGQPELNAAFHVLTSVLGSMGSMQGGGSVYNTKVEDLQSHIDTTTTEATNQNQALFQYITLDRGLLTLYGSLINDGLWQLDAGKIAAAESIGEYNNSVWIYKTMLPLYWSVSVCNWNDNCGSDNYSFLEEWGLNVSGPWWAVLGQSSSPYDYVPAPEDTLSTRVFGSVQGNCQLGGTDPSSNWDYSAHVAGDTTAQGCNLGLDVTPILYFENGWTFSCMVFTGSSAPYRAHNCGDGPPDGYGPPGS